MSIISVRNLTFEYGGGKRALDHVSFDIAAGSITALVGPNGAGKTTLLRCLVGLDTPLEGSIVMDGLDVVQDPRAAHRQCGYLSDYFGLYDSLTVRQSLTYMAWCQGMKSDDIGARIDELTGFLHLTEKVDAQAGTLSRGNRQRLGIALALMHDPKILILDEPASGLDPEARANLSSLMLRLRTRGKTILVSSHILNELEDYCTDMLVIRDGKVGDHVVLKEYREAAQVAVRVDIAGDAAAHVAAVAAIEGVGKAQAEGGHIIIHCANSAAEHSRILKALVGAAVPVSGYHVTERKLQDAYMELADKKTTKGEGK